MICSPQDIFLCTIYIPPVQSPYFKEDTFPNIENEINHFQVQGSVLITGDLNSRTGEETDLTNTLPYHTGIIMTKRPIAMESSSCSSVEA